MTLPSTNLKMSQMQTEFPAPPNPISMSNFYRGGSYVPSGQTATPVDPTPIPTSGTIRMGEFRGQTKVSSFTPVLRVYTGSTATALTETVPTGATNVVIEAWGSGGPGGAAGTNVCIGKGGGGGGAGGYCRTSVACTGGQTFSTTYGSAAATIVVTGATIATMTGNQGSGGTNGNNTGTTGVGGPGGTASGGNQANITGNAGSNGCLCQGGAGGAGTIGTSPGNVFARARGRNGNSAGNVQVNYGAANYRSVTFYYT